MQGFQISGDTATVPIPKSSQPAQRFLPWAFAVFGAMAWRFMVGFLYEGVGRLIGPDRNWGGALFQLAGAAISGLLGFNLLYFWFWASAEERRLRQMDEGLLIETPLRRGPLRWVHRSTLPYSMIEGFDAGAMVASHPVDEDLRKLLGDSKAIRVAAIIRSGNVDLAHVAEQEDAQALLLWLRQGMEARHGK